MIIVLGSERSPGGGNDNPLQYSCLRNPMDRAAWRGTVNRVARSRTLMTSMHTHTHTHILFFLFLADTFWDENVEEGDEQNEEKAMAPHSSTLAWKIPWIEEPGGLQSMGSLRVRHDWATLLSFFTFMHWRRKWQPTPVFFPGGFRG